MAEESAVKAEGRRVIEIPCACALKSMVDPEWEQSFGCACIGPLTYVSRRTGEKGQLALIADPYVLSPAEKELQDLLRLVAHRGDQPLTEWLAEIQARARELLGE